MKNIFKGKKILLTGGAGSVGHALAKEILKYNPETIRIFDISENEMFNLKMDCKGEEKLRYLNGDIRDINRVRIAMEDIDIVIHLAAMKHVFACEYNPFEAVKTNIEGLQNVINVARENNIERMIFTSTDKAASPSNVMGMTKLLGEKLITLANYYKGSRKTVFVSVRFGNVIGSNGSVIPLFKKQIATDKPVTITDKEMTRFVITMEEAIELIMNAIKHAKGGETFIWKMRTLKIFDLAETMIEKYGNGKKIKIEFIGKYDGEKLHEEIISPDEEPHTIEMENYYIILPQISALGFKIKFTNSRIAKNPVWISNKNNHMSKIEISKLLDSLNN